MMKQLIVEIAENKKITAEFYMMRLKSPYLAANSKPGQFVEVKCGDETDPLLRRPIGVHRVVKGGIELLYEVVGRGTEIMSRMKENGTCDLIGPVGNGFDIPPHPGASILVAGGNGAAPLLFLAEKLAREGSKTSVLIGGCSKSHILCEKEFKKTGAEVLVSTEDGSKGRKGLVTHLLSELLRGTWDEGRGTKDVGRRTIYACGPAGMLKAVSRIAEDNRVSCQVSLEEHMACGIGVCLGCPVKVLAGQRVSGLASLPAHPRTRAPAHYTYKMVCKDGPVFDSAEIFWE